MIPIAHVKDVFIHSPQSGHISFYNSPYPAHISNAAVDIYFDEMHHDFIPSPVLGEVHKIYDFNPPSSKYFQVKPKEQLVILKTKHNPLLYMRILHVTPTIKVGDQLMVGDEIGTLIRSGFYDYWTDPHLHIEVRKNNNILRARGSLPLTPCLTNGSFKIKDNSLNDLKIVEIKKDYVLLKSQGFSKFGKIFGVTGAIQGELGILDGGIPHYTFGALYMSDTHSLHVGEHVKLNTTVIGTIINIKKNFAVFRTIPISIYINNVIPVKGLSFYLHLFNRNLIKIIPYKHQSFPLTLDEPVELIIKA